MSKCLDPELHEVRPCDCPGVVRISDTMRLDHAIAHPDTLMDWKYGEPYGIKTPKDPRKAIDAAIRAERRRKRA